MGVYSKSGVMIEDSGRPFRYPNGSGHIPIDRNESRAMRAFALDYLQPAQQNVSEHQLPVLPSAAADAQHGSGYVVFLQDHRHLCRHRRRHDHLQTAASPLQARRRTAYWNVLPDDAGLNCAPDCRLCRRKGYLLRLLHGHRRRTWRGGQCRRPAFPTGRHRLEKDGRRRQARPGQLHRLRRFFRLVVPGPGQHHQALPSCATGVGIPAWVRL